MNRWCNEQQTKTDGLIVFDGRVMGGWIVVAMGSKTKIAQGNRRDTKS